MSSSKYHSKWRDLIRSLILCRDGFRCYLCAFQSLSNHIHHIDDNKRNNEPYNLITLCPSCHLKFTSGRYKLALHNAAQVTPLQNFFNTQVLEVLRLHALEL